MAFLLSAFLAAMILMETLGVDAGLAPGLTLRNAMLYMIAVFLVFKFTLGRGFKPEMGAITACFVFLIIYALGSAVVAAQLVEYRGYDLAASLMMLKRMLFDFMVGFTIFFYGTKTEKETLTVLNACLAVAVFTNVVSVLHGMNIIHLSTISDQASGGGRLQGIMGEHNQNGAYIALFIPPLVAAATSNTGWLRMLWVGGLLASLAGTLMSASRGSIVGTMVSAMWGIYVFRRHIPARKVVVWAGATILVLALIVIALSAQFGELMKERFIGQSKSVDSGELTSGRTDMWSEVVNYMAREPITFLTGYGWNVYDSMPFHHPPHNVYLGYWFGLGLPGVIAFVTLIVLLMRSASTIVDSAPPTIRPHLMGFAVGTLALAISIFFVELYRPWPFFWAYAGVVMRLVIISRSEGKQRTAEVRDTVMLAAAKTSKDSFGWTARGASH